MEVLGKYPIHPILFYSGKIAGYVTWFIFLFVITGIIQFNIVERPSFAWFSYVIGATGLLYLVMGTMVLGRSTRLGLPTSRTALKTQGIYTISRNPIYVGFDLLTLSSMIYIATLWIILLGVYSIIIYHFIILGEEKYLENEFGAEYLTYKQNTRRYV